MIYRNQRDYENLQKMMFEGVGQYEVPAISPGNIEKVDNWIGFNYARTCEEPEEHGVHFFVDDYQFLRLWKDPDRYLNMLRKFQAVCTPDFSMYTDFPRAVCIYNHYRKHWLGAYWQMHGIKVIPTIAWIGKDSYEWCFDGEPEGYTVAVSSVGTQVHKESRQLFIDGYKEMLVRLQPEKIIFYGEKIPDECTGNIIHVKSFQQKWRTEQK